MDLFVLFLSFVLCPYSFVQKNSYKVTAFLRNVQEKTANFVKKCRFALFASDFWRFIAAYSTFCPVTE